jgi:hypothetical protein
MREHGEQPAPAGGAGGPSAVEALLEAMLADRRGGRR